MRWFLHEYPCVRSVVCLGAFVPMVLATGCSPLVYYVPSGAVQPTSPRPATEVQLFMDAVPPSCRYQELGYLEGESRSAPSARTITAMREEAARHGADAIVLRTHQAGAHGVNHVYTAVAVRLLDGPCLGTK